MTENDIQRVCDAIRSLRPEDGSKETEVNVTAVLSGFDVSGLERKLENLYEAVRSISDKEDAPVKTEVNVTAVLSGFDVSALERKLESISGRLSLLVDGVKEIADKSGSGGGKQSTIMPELPLVPAWLPVQTPTMKEYCSCYRRDGNVNITMHPFTCLQLVMY